MSRTRTNPKAAPFLAEGDPNTESLAYSTKISPVGSNIYFYWMTHDPSWWGRALCQARPLLPPFLHHNRNQKTPGWFWCKRWHLCFAFLWMSPIVNFDSTMRLSVKCLSFFTQTKLTPSNLVWDLSSRWKKLQTKKITCRILHFFMIKNLTVITALVRSMTNVKLFTVKEFSINK